MTAAEILAELRGRGVTLVADGERLRYRPRDAVTPRLRAALAEHRAELLRLIDEACSRSDSQNPHNPRNQLRATVPSTRHIAEALPFLAMTLDEFQARGALLEVQVPWLLVTLWMVPADRDAAQLMAEGVRRGRIWTSGELMQLMGIADRTPETVKTVTHAKLEMDGEITEVRLRPHEERDA